jgi:hypothetical protein
MRIKERKMCRPEGLPVEVPFFRVYDIAEQEPIPADAEQVPDNTPLTNWVRED